MKTASANVATLASVAAFASVVALFVPSGLVADTAQDKRFPESEYRHNVLEQVKYSVGNIRLLVQGLEAGDDALRYNARTLHTATLMMKGAFEKDTRGVPGKTDARDEIWENWDDFSGRVDGFVKDSGTLLGLVESGGEQKQTAAALRKVFGNCKGCHDSYKKD